MLFSLFSPFDHFWSVRLFCLFCFFFSCSSLRVCIVSHICMHGWYLDTPHTHHIPLHDLWRPCVDLGILDSQFAPPHPCLNYVLRSYLCLCLPCFAFAGCECIPLHPSEPITTLLSPSLPFYVCTHICVFLGESYHSSPFLSLFLLFDCALVSVGPTTPIQTHIHPHTFIYTRTHPR